MDQFKVVKMFDRLDKIVFNHYGDLSLFDDVVSANPHLTSSVLVVGDKVYLPVIKVKKIEETLW